MRLAALSSYVPATRVSVTECVTASGTAAAEAKAFGRLFGFEKVAQTTTDMPLSQAFCQVLDGLNPRVILPDTVIYVHGNPVQYAEGNNPLQALLEHHPMLAAVEDVYEMDQQNCSTLFWALDAARGLLAEAARSVLILAGDSLHQMPLAERYAPGVTVIGDAYCALLLDDMPGGTQIENIWLKSRKEFYFGRFGSEAQSADFNAAHSEMVAQILDHIGFDPASTEPILGHNVNRLCWSRYAKESGIDPNRIWLDLLPDTGHCYTVDAALMLARLYASDHSGAAMLSVGQGGFLGGCRVRKEAA